jgi:hypothetical protein
LSKRKPSESTAKQINKQNRTVRRTETRTTKKKNLAPRMCKVSRAKTNRRSSSSYQGGRKGAVNKESDSGAEANKDCSVPDFDFTITGKQTALSGVATPFAWRASSSMRFSLLFCCFMCLNSRIRRRVHLLLRHPAPLRPAVRGWSAAADCLAHFRRS